METKAAKHGGVHHDTGMRQQIGFQLAETWHEHPNMVFVEESCAAFHPLVDHDVPHERGIGNGEHTH